MTPFDSPAHFLQSSAEPFCLSRSVCYSAYIYIYVYIYVRMHITCGIL